MHSNLLPSWVSRRSRIVMEEFTVTEIVFLGRLELKKGLVNFCDALDKVSKAGVDTSGVKITFLGRITDTEKLVMRGGIKV